LRTISKNQAHFSNDYSFKPNFFVLSNLQLIIYHLLRGLAKFVIFCYFRKIYVHHRENFKLKGPTIIISNHPNTLLDPVIIAGFIEKPIFFLANAGLFKHPWAATLLRYLYCIEVKRVEDTGVILPDNTTAFDQSSRHLAANGNIYIAVEGTSYMERVLRPLRTGFARIGFQAITGHAKNQEVYILPIGLNYEKHDKLGYDLEINVGESIPFSHYLADYHKNNQSTIKTLTAEMRSVLERLVIHTSDLEEEALLLHIESLFYGKPKSKDTSVFDTYRLYLQHIRKWEQERGIAFQIWKKALFEVINSLTTLKFSIKILSQIYHKTFPLLEKNGLAILGFPVYVYALLNHFFAIWVPRQIRKKLNLYVGYTSTVKILAAIVLAPLAYTVQFIILSNYLSIHLAIINVMLLPASAWFLFKYEKNVNDLFYYYWWKRSITVTYRQILERRLSEVITTWYAEAEKIKNPSD
jgi:1-acyl-sn-glycerol-3-phosphate acyltransferase